MFDSLCQSVHKTLIAGRCPWCGYVIIDGQAFDPIPTSLLPDRVLEEVARLRAHDRMLEEIVRLLPHLALKWGLKPAQPEPGEPEASDELLAIIEQCGPDAKQAIPLLLAALKDADANVRLAATNALGRMGPNARESLPSLFMLLEDKDQLVRDAAEEAIKNIDR